MLRNPGSKYGIRSPYLLETPAWVTRATPELPIWCSIDLRDGNQALPEVMGPTEKLDYFEMLLAIGFKEIEVGFPAASEFERMFIRMLIEEGRIPEGVTIQALARANIDDIRTTFETLSGARRAIVHFYIATSPIMRGQVLRMSRSMQIAHAVKHAELCVKLAGEYSGTEWQFEFSPEMFTQTEIEHALEVCNAVINELAVHPGHIIINLPATVEQGWPDEYAHRIEYMSEHLLSRDRIVLSLHPHNDRGTGVAAAALALKAGGQRVEGCLFGNGERAGNLDVFTLAMNFYADGIAPGLDFSDLPKIIETYERCTGISVHERHPYGGSLVFTAFSGTHQDAINKTTLNQQADGHWQIAYNNIDPADIGKEFDAVGINSQSGSGGIALVLRRHHGIALPKRMQKEFGSVMQLHMEEAGGGLHSPQEIWSVFQATYVKERGPYHYLGSVLQGGEHEREVTATLLVGKVHKEVCGKGNGPIDAFVSALRTLGHELNITEYNEQSLSSGAGAQALALVHVNIGDWAGYGCGISTDTVEASFRAVVNALNNALGNSKNESTQQ